MSIRLTLIPAVLGAVVLSSCGGGGGGSASAPSPPPVAAGLHLDTTAILAQARQPSETTEPFTVDGGALTLTDASDTSDPIVVTGP